MIIVLLQCTLYFLFFVIIGTLILIGYYFSELSIFYDTNFVYNLLNDNTSIISGTLIGLSALLASTTIMTSMEKTLKIERRKEKRDLYDRRILIFKNIDILNTDIENNSLTKEKLDTFINEVSSSRFLFEDDIVKSIISLTTAARNIVGNKKDGSKEKRKLLTKYQMKRYKLNQKFELILDIK